MSAADRRTVPFLPGGPEAMLHVGDVCGTAAGGAGKMRTGLWVLGADGAVCAGAIGVLIDDVWGGVAVAGVPPERWGVSTEMTVNLAAPLPADGSLVYADGVLVHCDDTVARATGTVRTSDGRVVATGAQRVRIVSGPDPQIAPPTAAPARDKRRLPELLALRDGVMEAGNAHANPVGNIHGGILLVAAEAAAAAATGAVGAGLRAETLSILYLRPAHLDGPLRVETEIAHQGRTTATAIVRCRRPDDQVCTLATIHYGPVGPSNR